MRVSVPCGSCGGSGRRTLVRKCVVCGGAGVLFRTMHEVTLRGVTDDSDPISDAVDEMLANTGYPPDAPGAA